MQVIHLIARLNDGGPARVVCELALATTAAGHDCVVWHGSTDADEVDLTPQLIADGVATRLISGLSRRVAPLADVMVLIKLIAALRRARPDVVHTHTAKAGAIGRLACALLHIPCVHTFHGHVLHGYFAPGMNRALRVFERILAARCDLHSLTPSLVHDLAHRHGLGRRRRWHHIPIPVRAVTPQAAAWHERLPTGTQPVIGFLGRCAPVKDLPLWLLTLRHIKRQLAVRGVVCGDGPTRATGETMAQQLRLPVRFVGTVPTGEALGAMDLLLMTSRNEGLPLAAVEAAAAGVPVVTPAVGGLKDLHHSGLVVATERSPQALAAAVVALLQDAKQAHERKLCAESAASAYEPAVVTPSYLSLYQQVAQRR